ncbi:hypothetical protein COV19_01920 [Candidatus Woesearchaeota archaeon CG10_big_fil_rev_8_21_14_0_10_44_13]|nr:MAG: hypothetical protein COV19_01920 [Candidatus Woesearchaeota archaeon CG10_big_fil_rev_8_21_14_0_10_44_13]
MRKLVYLAFVLSILLVSACKVQEAGQQEAKPVNMVIDSQTPQQAETEILDEKPEEVVQQNATQENTAPVQEAKPKVELSDNTCGEAATLGKISCVYKDNDLSIELKNAGRDNLEGIVYRFYDVNYVLIGEEQEMMGLKVGETKEYTIPLSKYDETKKVDVHPVEGGKICSNKQLVVIPNTNCV